MRRPILYNRWALRLAARALAMNDKDQLAKRYTLGYGSGALGWMKSRTAEGHGAFLLPYLSPGTRWTAAAVRAA